MKKTSLLEKEGPITIEDLKANFKENDFVDYDYVLFDCIQDDIMRGGQRLQKVINNLALINNRLFQHNNNIELHRKISALKKELKEWRTDYENR